jgi:hypothetical protein
VPVWIDRVLSALPPPALPGGPSSATISRSMKCGSSTSSGCPMARNVRSAIFWVEADSATYLPSLQR